jgi:hypothetical protein
MELLVSVRSTAAVETALAGGADIIDAKEPSRLVGCCLRRGEGEGWSGRLNPGSGVPRKAGLHFGISSGCESLVIRDGSRNA